MDKYTLSTDALHDLKEIWEYIAVDNVVAADKVEYSLYSEFERISNTPYIGHKRDDLTDKPVRFWNLYSYQIIYNPEASPIQIIRILSGYRDIAGIME